MNKAFQPLHQKYRPENFDGVVGQEPIASTLKQALKSNRIAPAYLFSGPRGTGKTSSARILAKSLNCLESSGPTPTPCGKCATCRSISNGTSLDVIEIDAASNTGVDNIRDLIERSRFAPVQTRWKVYVIDECHMLSTAAFNALLKTLEEPPPNVVFILATTDPQRVLPTIMSRCQKFDFRQIPLEILTNHLKSTAVKEDISIEEDALEIVCKKAQGGLRDGLSMLDQLSLLPQPIQSKAVWELLGLVEEKQLINIVSALAERDPIKLLDTIRGLLNEGREPLAILQGTASVLRDLLILNSAPDRQDLLNISKDLSIQLSQISTKIGIEKLFHWQAKLKGSENQLRQSMQPRLWLEIIILGILDEVNSKIEPSIQDRKITPQNKHQDLPNIVKTLGNPSEDALLEKSVNDKQSSSHNLPDLWTQILERLELPSTKMLLSQQAQLIHLSEKKAVIQVANNWMGMVQSRLGILEQAINSSLENPRQVILEPIDEIKSKELKASSEKKSNGSSKHGGLKVGEGPLQSEEVVKKVALKDEKDNQGNKNSVERSTNNENVESTAKDLADFFGGKVLEIEE